MRRTVHRVWVLVLAGALAALAPAGAAAQSGGRAAGVAGIEADESGITISPLPGLLPSIRIHATGLDAPPPARPAPRPAPAEAWGSPRAEPQTQWGRAPDVADAAAPEAAAPPGRTFGVFVGISDYPSGSDLQFCAHDAVRVQQAFVEAGIIEPLDSVVLTDHRATRAAVLGAVQRLRQQLGPQDTLVFFFSGHGNRVADAEGDEVDGTDETLALADGALSDDELARALAGGQGRSFVALDSCYSGGFAPDVARLSDSVGFYASREDQLSYVAQEHRAGGYLSYHLAESVARSQGRPTQMWQLQRDLSDGFARSGAAGRQDLTVGVSRSVNTRSVLFEGQPPATGAMLAAR